MDVLKLSPQAARLQLKTSVYKFITTIVGARERVHCPNCGSEDWFKKNYYSSYTDMYTDGTDGEGQIDYDWCANVCLDCDHSE